jgi:prepilin-type N-terminal cleavage/methylation domain-containing protein
VGEEMKIGRGGEKPASASRGFTLIELVVVIGIMAILTVASFPGIANTLETRNSIMISSAKLASLSQQSNRTVRFYTGGSIQFLKS